MKINDEDIKFFQWAYKLLSQPNRYPDGNKVVDAYNRIYQEEIKEKKTPYFRSLSPGCISCIKHCVYTIKNDLVKLGILDIKGDFIK